MPRAVKRELTGNEAALAIIRCATEIVAGRGTVKKGSHNRRVNDLLVSLVMSDKGRGHLMIIGSKGTEPNDTKRAVLLSAKWSQRMPLSVGPFERGPWEREFIARRAACAA